MTTEKRIVGENLEVEMEICDLTDRELVALYHLSKAWDAFYDPDIESDPYGRLDLEKFIHAVHTAQNVIMARKFSDLSITLKEED